MADASKSLFGAVFAGATVGILFTYIASSPTASLYSSQSITPRTSTKPSSLTHQLHPIPDIARVAHQVPLPFHPPSRLQSSSKDTWLATKGDSKAPVPLGWVAATVGITFTALMALWKNRKPSNGLSESQWAMAATVPDSYFDQLSLLTQETPDDLYEQMLGKSVGDAAEVVSQGSPAVPSDFNFFSVFEKPAKQAGEVLQNLAVSEPPAPPPVLPSEPLTAGLSSLDTSAYDALVGKAVTDVAPSVPLPQVEEVVAGVSKAASETAASMAKVIEESVAVPNPLDAAQDLYESLINRAPESSGLGTAISKQLEKAAEVPNLFDIKTQVVDAVAEKAAKFAEPAADFTKKAEAPLVAAGATASASLEQATKAVNDAIAEVTKTFNMLNQALTGQTSKVTSTVVNAQSSVEAVLASSQAQILAIRDQLPPFIQPYFPEDPNVVLAGSALLAAGLLVGLPAYALYNLRYGGYSGDLTPDEVIEMLQESNALLLDIRNPADVDGVPDLRRSIRNKVLAVAPESLPAGVRKRTKEAAKVEQVLQALTTSSLKPVRKAQAVIVMDKDGTQGRTFARLLRERGIRKPYVLEGGYQKWVEDGLEVRGTYQADLVEQLKQDVEAMAEDDDNIIGRVNAFINSESGKVYLGLGAGLGVLALANIKVVAELAVLGTATKLAVDALTGGSYLKPRVGPYAQDESIKSAEKVKQNAFDVVRQAKVLQQSIATNLKNFQYLIVRDLWDLPAGDALKVQEERIEMQKAAQAAARPPVPRRVEAVEIASEAAPTTPPYINAGSSETASKLLMGKETEGPKSYERV